MLSYSYQCESCVAEGRQQRGTLLNSFLRLSHALAGILTSHGFETVVFIQLSDDYFTYLLLHIDESDCLKISV